jgi:enoyl-CoA hydratase
MGSRVNYEVTDQVASVTMDDGKVNALGFEMFEELNEAFTRAESDAAAVVLSGRDGVFSAGFDLKVLKGGGPDMVRLLMAGFEFSYRSLSFPLPMVMACTGHAFAMGVFVLLSGDYRVGAVGADHKITANEVAIGMTMPRAAIEICRQRLTESYIDRVIVQAEVFDPSAAAMAGLLDAVAGPDELLQTAHEKAAALGRLDLPAFKATKLRIRANSLQALRAAMEADEAELSAF